MKMTLTTRDLQGPGFKAFLSSASGLPVLVLILVRRAARSCLAGGTLEQGNGSSIWLSLSFPEITTDKRDKENVNNFLHNPESAPKNSQLIHDPLCFQNLRIFSIYRKNPQSARFFRPNPLIRKT